MKQQHLINIANILLTIEAHPDAASILSDARIMAPQDHRDLVDALSLALEQEPIEQVQDMLDDGLISEAYLRELCISEHEVVLERELVDDIREAMDVLQDEVKDLQKKVDML